MESTKNPTKELKKRSWLGRDVYLNVGPKEALVRVIIGLLLGGLVFWVSSLGLIILITVVSFYLFISSAMLFCYVKYFWRHSILNIKDPVIKDPDIPVKKL